MPEYPITLDNSSDMAYGPTSSMGDKHPVLTLHWNKDYDLPDMGEMTVTFHKHRQTDTDQEGKISQTVELHIMTIESVKEDKSAPKKSARAEAEDALDSYAAEVEDEY